MIHHLGLATLRPLEPRDRDQLHGFKNDPEIAAMLGGFSSGYSFAGIDEWIEHHRRAGDEVLWAIARDDGDQCIGHVGLYHVDHRIGSAEFALLIGDRAAWGRGIGKAVTRFVLGYAFRAMNLNRVCLTVLATNERAIQLYRSIGFVEEGRQREAQYKEGRYVDVILMSLLRREFTDK